MKIKMDENSRLFIIGARTNTPLLQVKEIYARKFSGPKDKNLPMETKLHFLENHIMELKNTQEFINQNNK
tara:strand:+ start:183 stop:392 length:210 start_codon:yes stop_codon:yes gene_type:complete